MSVEPYGFSPNRPSAFNLPCPICGHFTMYITEYGIMRGQKLFLCACDMASCFPYAITFIAPSPARAFGMGIPLMKQYYQLLQE